MNDRADLTGLVDGLEAIVGANAVIADAHDRAPYENDWRDQWHGRAAAVVKPGSTDEVSRVVKFLAGRRIAIVPQGGNTSMCGGSVPDASGTQVVVNLSRMNRVRNVDPANNTMTVEAGCVLAALQEAAGKADRLFPLSLGAEGSCEIGGNLSTNAGGTAVLRYGNTRELVLGLEVVLPDGTVWDGLRALRKDNTGYDLKHLFVGAEGTLGIITAAVLKLFPKPRSQATAIVAVADPHAALTLLALPARPRRRPCHGLRAHLAHLPRPRLQAHSRHARSVRQGAPLVRAGRAFRQHRRRHALGVVRASAWRCRRSGQDRRRRDRRIGRAARGILEAAREHLGGAEARWRLHQARRLGAREPRARN